MLEISLDRGTRTAFLTLFLAINCKDYLTLSKRLYSDMFDLSGMEINPSFPRRIFPNFFFIDVNYKLNPPQIKVYIKSFSNLIPSLLIE